MLCNLGSVALPGTFPYWVHVTQSGVTLLMHQSIELANKGRIIFSGSQHAQVNFDQVKERTDVSLVILRRSWYDTRKKKSNVSRYIENISEAAWNWKPLIEWASMGHQRVTVNPAFIQPANYSPDRWFWGGLSCSMSWTILYWEDEVRIHASFADLLLRG